MTPLLLGVLLATLDGGAPDAGAAGFDQRTREVMHTLVTVSLPSTLPAAQREAAFSEAFAVFAEIDATLDEARPDSALAKVNAGAGGPGVDAPAGVCEVVRLALDGARRTDGLFDPTWASVRALWRFGERGGGAVPPPGALKAACAAVGFKKVEVRDAERPGPQAACRIRLATKGTQLGLGGVVKGWGVDRVVRALRARGLVDFAVQAGGDLYVAGRRDGQPWRAELREPRGGPHESFARLELSDAAFSTSGDWDGAFDKDGVRYHQLIDLRGCAPARASASASVLAKSATDAEFLTKAAFILGPKAGQAVVRAFGAEAVWVTPDGRVHTTPGLEKRLLSQPPKGFPARPR